MKGRGGIVKIMAVLCLMLLAGYVFAEPTVVNDPPNTAAVSQVSMDIKQSSLEAAAGRADAKKDTLKSLAQDADSLVRAIDYYAKAGIYWENHLEKITGTRPIGDIVGDVRRFAEKSFQEQLIKNLKLNEMLAPSSDKSGGQASDFINRFSLFSICAGLTVIAKLDCEKEVANKASGLDGAEKMSRELDDVLRSATDLARRAEESKDAKESQDLSNAIAIKKIELTALQTQWNANVEQEQVRDTLLEKKGRAEFLQRQSTAPALTFN